MLTEVISLDATDTDVLGNAQSVLETAPEDGRYEIWISSDQADGLVSIMAGSEVILEDALMQVETASHLGMDKAPLVALFVDGGARIIISYTEATAATATFGIRFSGDADLLSEGIDLEGIFE